MCMVYLVNLWMASLLDVKDGRIWWHVVGFGKIWKKLEKTGEKRTKVENRGMITGVVEQRQEEDPSQIVTWQIYSRSLVVWAHHAFSAFALSCIRMRQRVRDTHATNTMHTLSKCICMVYVVDLWKASLVDVEDGRIWWRLVRFGDM